MDAKANLQTGGSYIFLSFSETWSILEEGEQMMGRGMITTACTAERDSLPFFVGELFEEGRDSFEAASRKTELEISCIFLEV